MPSLEERYFAQPEFYKALRDTLGKVAGSPETKLKVSGRALGIIEEEAFYCKTSVDEMPSRVVVYGSVVMDRLQSGFPIGFQRNPASSPLVRRSFINFPNLEDVAQIQHIATEITSLNDDEAKISLNSDASGLLSHHSEKNGLPEVTNFLALTSLVHSIGVNERAGNYLYLPEVDPLQPLLA